MGAVKNITFDKFPKQGSHLGRQVDVWFHFVASEVLKGVVVRDDAEEPCRLIIELEDGRHVLATECQYSYPR